MTDKPCFLYFIDAHTEGGLCKVGISKDPQKRLTGIKTSNPFRLALYSAVEFQSGASASTFESLVHCALEDYKSHGEWFTVSAEKALCVYDAIVDLISSKDFHPSDFVPLTQMIAFQVVSKNSKSVL